VVELSTWLVDLRDFEFGSSRGRGTEEGGEVDDRQASQQVASCESVFEMLQSGSPAVKISV